MNQVILPGMGLGHEYAEFRKNDIRFPREKKTVRVKENRGSKMRLHRLVCWVLVSNLAVFAYFVEILSFSITE